MKFLINKRLQTQFKRINSAGTLREPAEYKINNEYPFSTINSTDTYMYLSTAEELIIPVNTKEFMFTNYRINFTMDTLSEFNSVDVYYDNMFKWSFYSDTIFDNSIINQEVNYIKIVNNCLDGNIKVYFDTKIKESYLLDYNYNWIPLNIDTSNDIISIKVDNKVKSNLLYNDYVYTSIRNDKSNVYYQQDIVLKYEQYQQLKKLLDYSAETKQLISCEDVKQSGYDESFFGENFGSEETTINYSLISLKVNVITGLFYYVSLILRKESYDQYI